LPHALLSYKFFMLSFDIRLNYRPRSELLFKVLRRHK